MRTGLDSFRGGIIGVAVLTHDVVAVVDACESQGSQGMGSACAMSGEEARERQEAVERFLARAEMTMVGV